MVLDRTKLYTVFLDRPELYTVFLDRTVLYTVRHNNNTSNEKKIAADRANPMWGDRVQTALSVWTLSAKDVFSFIFCIFIGV